MKRSLIETECRCCKKVIVLDNRCSGCKDEQEKKTQTDEEKKIVDLSEVLRFMKQLAAEGKLDDDRMRKCLDTTYEYRRDFIIGHSPVVAVIREVYPGLFHFKQIIEEFKLIKTESIYDNFMNNLELYNGQLLKYAPQSRERDFIESEIKYHRNDKNHLKYIKTAGALIVLPLYFKVSVKDFILFNGKLPEDNLSVIVCGNSFKDCLNKSANFVIYAEKSKICECDDLRSAFFALMGTYYIFNIIYPSNFTEVMALIEKHFLKIEPELEESTKRIDDVVNLLNAAAVDSANQ